MIGKSTLVLVCVSIVLSGCAGLDFGKDGLAYYQPKPFLFVSTDKDCNSTATVISLPGDQKYVKFKRGLGSSNLSVAMSNGILTNVGQQVDSKVPETIAAITSMGTAIKAMGGANSSTVCKPSATLYPINNGVPDPDKPYAFPVVPAS